MGKPIGRVLPDPDTSHNLRPDADLLAVRGFLAISYWTRERGATRYAERLLDAWTAWTSRADHTQVQATKAARTVTVPDGKNTITTYVCCQLNYKSDQRHTETFNVTCYLELLSGDGTKSRDRPIGFRAVGYIYPFACPLPGCD